MSYLSLSDEADRARCESCEDDFNREDEGVDAECCGGWYCRRCWKIHTCLTLADYHGREVILGSKLSYLDDIAGRIYQVIEIVPTMTKGQTCVGEKVLKTKLDGKRHTMRVRLMEHV
jgi:hypothetical protein